MKHKKVAAALSAAVAGAAVLGGIRYAAGKRKPKEVREPDMANSGNTVDAYAEGALTEESGGASEEGSTEAETEGSAETGEDETGETESGSNEEETESGTVSGNEVPEPECTCEEKCTQYSADKDCEVCKGDYSLCEYVNPNVKITISTPSGGTMTPRRYISP